MSQGDEVGLVLLREVALEECGRSGRGGRSPGPPASDDRFQFELSADRSGRTVIRGCFTSRLLHGLLHGATLSRGFDSLVAGPSRTGQPCFRLAGLKNVMAPASAARALGSWGGWSEILRCDGGIDAGPESRHPVVPVTGDHPTRHEAYGLIVGHVTAAGLPRLPTSPSPPDQNPGRRRR